MKFKHKRYLIFSVILHGFHKQFFQKRDFSQSVRLKKQYLAFSVVFILDVKNYLLLPVFSFP